jgi:hypothetical protein
MPEPHIIRLRGPWELQPLTQWRRGADGPLLEVNDPLPPGGRLEMPSDWSPLLGADYYGRVRHRRRFGRPTGLDSGQIVWLVCDGAAGAANVALNGAPLGALLGPTTPVRFDVTDRLLARNELVIDVEFLAIDTASIETAKQSSAVGPNCGGLTGDVRLEIVG